MAKQAIVDTVYDMLCGQRFADWYNDNGTFGKHITGDEGAKSKNQIKEDIARLLGFGNEKTCTVSQKTAALALTALNVQRTILENRVHAAHLDAGTKTLLQYQVSELTNAMEELGKEVTAGVEF